MKNALKHTVAVTLALSALSPMLTACGSDDDPVAEVADGLTLEMENGEETSSFPSGASFGVFLIADNSYTVAASNVMFVAEEGSVSRAGFSLSEGIGICGYSPYREEWNGVDVTENQTFSIGADQRKDSVALMNDLMVAPFSYINDGKATLRFGRVMAKVGVRVTDRTGRYDLNGAEVILPSCHTEVSVNLLSGGVRTTDGVRSDVCAYISGCSQDTLAAEAVIPPGAAEKGNVLFVFNAGGHTFSYTLLENEDWESGKAYTYELELTDGGVVSVGGQVSDWEIGDSGTLEIPLDGK